MNVRKTSTTTETRRRAFEAMQLISWKDIFWVIIGSSILAFGINYFTIPNDLSEGGLIGITVIFYYLYGWDTGLVSLLANALLFVVGYRFLSRKTMLYSVISVAVTSSVLSSTANLATSSDSRLIGTVYAGILIGVGIGLVIRAGGTTGGGVIIARLMNKYLNLSIAVSMFIIDVAVVGASGFLFGEETMLYTLIAIIIGSYLIDLVSEGLNVREAVTIISHRQEEIATILTETLGRSATVIHSHGHFTKQKNDMLYMIVDKRQLAPLKQIVEAADPRAFVVIHKVREVIGEGFTYPSR